LTTAPAALLVRGAAVLDVESGEYLEGTDVLAVDGRIAEVDRGVRAPDGARVVDGAGRWVLPGLIDGHVHVTAATADLSALPTWAPSYVAAHTGRLMRNMLERGFTTVRDTGGADFGMARSQAEGLISGPRLIFGGTALSQTGGHGDGRPAESALCACAGHMGEVVDGVDALRRAVRDRFRRGAHAIKIMASGGVVSLTDPIRIPQYSAEEVRAVTDEATRRGSYVAAHAYSPEAIRHAVDNGVRSIEHGNLLDAGTAEVMAAAGAFLVPTLGTYEAMERRGGELGMPAVSRAKNREVLEAGRTAVQLARAAGVRVGFGTDLMGVLEEEQLTGMRVQVEVDGPLLALQSATSVNADLLGRSDLGRVQAGATADLLIVDGNPLEDPAVLWGSPAGRTVVQAGVVLDLP
jgi:imidazolonepropionase-like amidohydrolase